MEISATYPVQYNKPNMEYQKVTIKVNNEKQTEIVYTYNKHGHLIETVVRNHEIGSV